MCRACARDEGHLVPCIFGFAYKRTWLLQTLQHFGGCRVERNGQCLKIPQTNFSLTAFQLGYVVLADLRMFGKVNLPPLTRFPDLPDSLSKSDTDISCHSSSIAISSERQSLHTGIYAERWRECGSKGMA
jgi:hypothetical protein